MRTWCIAPVLLLLSAADGSEDPPPFLEGEEAGALESSLADRPRPQWLALRWRLQGSSLRSRQSRIYQRLEWRWRPGREVYLVAEKDPGESRLADFLAFYMRWKSSGRPLEFVVGNLRPGFARGVVFSRSRDRGGIPSIRLGGDSERIGNRSSAENPGLRGLAVRYRGKNFAGVVLGGRMRLDAREDEEGRVISLPETGLHITAREREGRALLGGRLLGVRLGCQGGWGEVGMVMQALSFERFLDLRRPRRMPWAFQGRVQQVWALDARIAAGPGSGVVEIARDRKGHWGLLAAIRSGRSQVRTSALLRYYAPGFHSFYGGSSSAVDMRNEQGYQLTLAGRMRFWRWRLYLDQFRRPQPGYFSPLPQVGEVWGMELGSRLRRDWKWRAVYQQRLRSPSPSPGRRAGMDLEKGTRLRLRLESRWVNASGGERGDMASVRWRERRKSWSFVFHFSRFRTSSYGTRIYEFEYDLPGAVSIRPLYGSGWRFYTVLGVEWSGLRLGGRYRLQRDAEARHYAGLQFDVNL